MILVPRAVRVYFATQPQNPRKSFDGLTNEIRHALGYDPLGGHAFVFLNKRRRIAKALWFDGSGWCISDTDLVISPRRKSVTPVPNFN